MCSTDLSMTATLDASLSVGAQLLSEMGRISRLHSKRVEQAGFAVLKSPGYSLAIGGDWLHFQPR